MTKRGQALEQELIALIPALRRYAYSLTGSMDDADDLVQSTCEKILVKAPPADAALSQWAFRLCRNAWIDSYRAAKTREQATNNPVLQAQNTVDGARQHEQAIEYEKVHRAMGELPDAQREIITLVSIEGMSYKDISQTLDMPQGTVMSRLARARKALAERLTANKKGAL